MAKYGGLGRGLDSLIPNKVTKKKADNTQQQEIKEDISVEQNTSEHENPNEAVTVEVEKEVKKKNSTQKKKVPNTLRISLVEPNREQPRSVFDEDAINELADSIQRYGMISPLIVKKMDDHYEIIAGERRWRAAKKAGLKEVPVIIKDISSQEAMEISLIENIQREDLNPMEEAKAYRRLIEEFELKQDEVAERVSKSRSSITNSLRLLKLVNEVQKLVEDASLSEGHARSLVAITDPELQKEAAEEIVKQGLSVRQTEQLVKQIQNQPAEPTPASNRIRDVEKEAVLKNIAEQLKGTLGTKVNIKQNGKNKGRIEIEFYSDDELDRLYELLRSIQVGG